MESPSTKWILNFQSKYRETKIETSKVAPVKQNSSTEFYKEVVEPLNKVNKASCTGSPISKCSSAGIQYMMDWTACKEFNKFNTGWQIHIASEFYGF